MMDGGLRAIINSELKIIDNVEFEKWSHLIFATAFDLQLWRRGIGVVLLRLLLVFHTA